MASRRTVALGLLWGAVVALGATVVALSVAFGPFPGPAVPVFAMLAVAAVFLGHAGQRTAARILTAAYGVLGFLFGLSHGYVLYAWPLMLAGAVLLPGQPPSPNPEPA